MGCCVPAPSQTNGFPARASTSLPLPLYHKIGIGNGAGHSCYWTCVQVQHCREAEPTPPAPWWSTLILCCVAGLLSLSEYTAGTEVERCVFSVVKEEGKSANVLEGAVAGMGGVEDGEEGDVGVLGSATGDSRDPLRSMVSMMYSLLSRISLLICNKESIIAFTLSREYMGTHTHPPHPPHAYPHTHPPHPPTYPIPTTYPNLFLVLPSNRDPINLNNLISLL